MLVRDFGTALKFDGVDDVVSMGAAAACNLTGSTLTIAVWMKTAYKNDAKIIGNYDPSNSGYVFSTNTSGQIRLEMRTASANYSLVQLANVFDSEYHLVGVTYNGTNVQFYVDGVPIGSTQAATGNIITATQNFIVGRAPWAAGLYYQGYLDDPMVFSTALSAAAWQALYAQGVVPSGLVGRWKFDEGGGAATIDSSGNANTGTITSATYTADVPLKSRIAVDNNLVNNGDFEFVPPFVAATTSSSSWVNGTATGTNADHAYLPFTWAAGIQGTGSVQYDTSEFYGGAASMKMVLSSASSGDRALVCNNRNWQTDPGVNMANYAGIRALPSTSYTLSFRWKGSNLATNQAHVRMFGATVVGGTGTDLATINGNPTAWAQVTQTFTTGAATAFIFLYFQNGKFGFTPNSGSTLWVDDIVLRPTVV